MKHAAELADAWAPKVIATRRYLHQHPEVSGQEHQTAQYLYEQLCQCDNLQVSRPCPTGVVAVLRGKKPGRTYAARCDIDALPLTETDQWAFASQTPGVMHACGHDGNTAILLRVAQILSAHPDEVSGQIKFLFQPCEEAHGGGASELVQAGVVDDVDLILGAHVDAATEPGIFLIKDGPTHAAVYGLRIHVCAAGGHGGFPHQCTDTVLVGAEIICALNSIVAKNLDPCKSAVVTITMVQAANAHNIIPDEVILGGTLRTLNEEVEPLLVQRIHTLCQGIAQAYGASCQVYLDKQFSVLYNDPGATAAVREILRGEFGEERVQGDMPVLGGEDFSQYLTRTQGCYFKIGTKMPREGIVYPHHHSRFCLHEDGLRHGVHGWLTILTQLEDYLNQSAWIGERK